MLVYLAQNDPAAFGVAGLWATIAAGALGVLKVCGDVASKTRLSHERRRSTAAAVAKLTRLTDALGRHGPGAWVHATHDGFRQHVAETLQDLFQEACPGRSFRVLLYQARTPEAGDPAEANGESPAAGQDLLRLVGRAVADGSEPPDRITRSGAGERGFPDIFACFDDGGMKVSKRADPPEGARWQSAVFVRVSTHRDHVDGELRPAWGTIHVDSPAPGSWTEEPFYHNLLTLAASLLSVAASHVDTQLTKEDQREGMRSFHPPADPEHTPKG
ncbi:hypothetical protein [Micrococcus luteus]|uniref:hypothetical protein n=1 Tax=Micrococcus luteus TaxID=1270 RepID=UPI0037FF93EF